MDNPIKENNNKFINSNKSSLMKRIKPVNSKIKFEIKKEENNNEKKKIKLKIIIP